MGDSVGVGVLDGVSVGVGDSVAVAVQVGVGVAVKVAVGVGVRVGQGKYPAPQILQCLIRAFFVDDEIGAVKWGTPNNRGGDGFKPIHLFRGSVRSGTDKGQIDLTFGKEGVYFLVGLPLNQLNAVSQVICDIVKQLVVVNEGFLGGDHGRYGHAQLLGVHSGIGLPGNRQGV